MSISNFSGLLLIWNSRGGYRDGGIMKRLLWLTLLAGCSQTGPSPTPAASTATPTPQAAASPLARFALLNDKAKVKQDTRLSAPSHLTFRVEGTGTVVLAAFEGNKADSPHSMPPIVLQLKGDEQRVDWTLRQPMPSGRLYVAVLPEGCAKAKEMVELVQGWKANTAPKARQVTYDRLVAWEQAIDPSLRHEGEAIEVTGGVTSHSAFNGNVETSRPKSAAVVNLQEAAGGRPLPRGGKDEPDWRPQADSVESSADQPGVYSYPIQFASQ